jgi:hypothetical protein
MIGGCERLAAHIRAREGRMFLAAVAPERWERARLYLELARADYAASPVLGRGWLVLANLAVPVAPCAEVTGGWENLLRVIARGCRSGEAVLSEGWARAARDDAPEAAPAPPARPDLERTRPAAPRAGGRQPRKHGPTRGRGR